MSILDVFNGDGFSVVSLTDAINSLKFVPGYVGSRGLFGESSVSTTTVAIEQKGDTLKLIPPTPRGAPGTTIEKTARSMLSINVPHFQIDDAVMAEEVQNVRPFGQESGQDSVMRLIGERMQIHGQSHEATLEYSRIGAIKGLVTYADGSILDLFKIFGVTKEAVIDFNLDATSTTGAFRKACAAVTRQMAGILDGTPFVGIEAICGDNFFDNLIANAEVRDTWRSSLQAAELRTNYVNAGLTFGSFIFGGIMWTNYRGSVDGVGYVHTDHAHLYPVGVPGLFKTYVAPADYMETVNTLGLLRYAKQFRMPNDKGVSMEVQTNPLNICTRPRVLIDSTWT